MKRVERRARIGAPPEEVFAYLADLNNLSDWQSGIVEAELTAGSEMGVGATARVVREMMGQRMEAPLTVTAYDPPRSMAIGSEISGIRASAQLGIAPLDDGATDLTFAMEIRGSLLTAFMEPMIAGAAGGDIDTSLQRVQEHFGAAPEPAG